jgi:hypothetical protein
MPAPSPEVVVKEVVVEKEVPVEVMVEKVVEVIKEVVVEKPVRVERIVEVEKIVVQQVEVVVTATPTPIPTATPIPSWIPITFEWETVIINRTVYILVVATNTNDKWGSVAFRINAVDKEGFLIGHRGSNSYEYWPSLIVPPNSKSADIMRSYEGPMPSDMEIPYELL